jgi:hypothetical protein
MDNVQNYDNYILICYPDKPMDLRKFSWNLFKCLSSQGYVCFVQVEMAIIVTYSLYRILKNVI